MSFLPKKFKNSGRLSSDNYSIVLVFKRLDNKMLDLTEHFGITNFEWESRDEITIRNPITRIDPIAILTQNGVDFSLESKKENLDDLMDLLLSQQNLYYGAGADGKKPTISLGANKRSNSSAIKNGVSIFNDVSSKNTVAPIYDLIIKISHYDIDGDSENKTELLTFKDVIFYKPFQRVSENSSSISEGFKGFASRIITGGGTKDISTFNDIVEKTFLEEFNTEKDAEDFPRRVINPDNNDLIE